MRRSNSVSQKRLGAEQKSKVWDHLVTFLFVMTVFLEDCYTRYLKRHEYGHTVVTSYLVSME